MTLQETWIFVGVAVLWVGGWGFFIYCKAEFVARINRRFALWGRKDVTPRRVKWIRRFGILAMIMAALSLVNEILMAVFHIKY
jgi:hypothetical protein